MAIDSRDKRMSLINIALEWSRVFQNPPDNGTIGDVQFEQWLYCYRGLQFTGPGDPRMKRWGGVTHMINKNFAGRGW